MNAMRDAPRVLGRAELAGLVGGEALVSPWVEVTQERIDSFAHASGDHQWIHVDRERASQGPFGGPIAHGFLTLSLLSALLEQTVQLAGGRMGVNYGVNRVRFTDPVPAGSRVRAHFRLAALEGVQGGVQLTWDVTLEREGAGKPALVAQWLTRRHD